MLKPALLTAVLLCLSVPAFAGHWKGDGWKKVTVTVHSSPEGAVVYANDARTYMGQTPIDLEYQLDGSDQCQIRQGLEVRWASGATATTARLTICPSRGKHQQLTPTRPDVPGLDTDIQVALQQQQTAAFKALAAAQQVAATQAIIANIPTVPLRRPVSCTSSRIGRQWFTNCY